MSRPAHAAATVRKAVVRIDLCRVCGRKMDRHTDADTAACWDLFVRTHRAVFGLVAP